MAFDPAADIAVSPLEPVAARRDRVALHVLQAGAIAVVLAATTWKQFELDRFFVPRELVLHITALVTMLLTATSVRRSNDSWIDRLLIAFLLLGVISALFATNRWLAMRALSLSASSVAIFWAARSLAQAGLARRLLNVIAFAVIAGAVTSLMQTYGVRTDLFSINRSPGGTLGNRNFVAHLAAFGFPIVLLAALRAKRPLASVAWSIGVALVIATLILTRSRAAWLAFAGALIVLLAAALLSRAIRTHSRTWRRLGGTVMVVVAGVAAALFLPNSLRWNSDNPYLDSMRDVANFQEGSGRGRLIQYRESIDLSLKNPLLGVGPGNWSVEYPRHAAPNDPSLNNAEPGTTANPWPSSDWVAFAAERGLLAAALLLAVIALLSLSALRRMLAAADADTALGAVVMLATLAGTIITGAFDAVLLLALPSLLIWAAFGALWQPAPPKRVGAGLLQRAGFAFVVFLSALGAVRSTTQLTAIGIYSSHTTASAARLAARIDPGNYRAHLRLARNGRNRQERCTHALAARRQFPEAAAARALSRGCSTE